MAILQMLYTHNHLPSHQSHHYLIPLHSPLRPQTAPLCLPRHQSDEVRLKAYISPHIVAMSAIQVLSLSAHMHIPSNLPATRRPCIVSNHGLIFIIHPPTKALRVLQHIFLPHMYCQPRSLVVLKRSLVTTPGSSCSMPYTRTMPQLNLTTGFAGGVSTAALQTLLPGGDRA
jgi:hypothetical protein